ncbi:MAG: spore coat protein CotJB [Firmicutes bacterium HGW-Firmicutes-14]|nr:MAG: spore coat protein CotJB [Firmicutes bacterium HGW-Firmicutes-14]
MNRKISHQAKLLKEIMSYEFTAVDLNLFLDTHPGDMRALAEYNQTVCQLKKLKHAYEQCYGPLANFGNSPSQHPWRWIDEPWPWQIEF